MTNDLSQPADPQDRLGKFTTKIRQILRGNPPTNKKEALAGHENRTFDEGPKLANGLFRYPLAHMDR